MIIDFGGWSGSLNFSLAFMFVLVPNGPAQPGTADFLGQGWTNFTFQSWKLLSSAATCDSSTDLFLGDRSLGFVFPLGCVAIGCFPNYLSWINAEPYLNKKSTLKYEFCRVLIHALLLVSMMCSGIPPLSVSLRGAELTLWNSCTKPLSCVSSCHF